VLLTISDKLFMVFLILLMISVVISGVGFQFMNWRVEDPEDNDGEPGSRKKRALDRQDKSLGRFYRSKLVWVSLAGMLISIVMSLIASK
jgi:hypothetical protein